MTRNPRHVSPPEAVSITSFILAGGESRRMGRPKALMVVNGETMLERLVRLSREVTSRVAVVGWPEGLPRSQYPKTLRRIPLLKDEFPGQGPMGGLITALRETTTEYNLVLGCDMSHVTSGFLEYLCRRALKSRADVTIPKSRERMLNPVCAVYRRRVLPAIESSLKAGRRKMTGFFPHVEVEVVTWGEMVRAGFEGRIFDTMNTPREYIRAKKHLNSQPQE